MKVVCQNAEDVIDAYNVQEVTSLVTTIDTCHIILNDSKIFQTHNAVIIEELVANDFSQVKE